MVDPRIVGWEEECLEGAARGPLHALDHLDPVLGQVLCSLAKASAVGHQVDAGPRVGDVVLLRVHPHEPGGISVLLEVFLDFWPRGTAVARSARAGGSERLKGAEDGGRRLNPYLQTFSSMTMGGLWFLTHVIMPRNVCPDSPFASMSCFWLLRLLGTAAWTQMSWPGRAASEGRGDESSKRV